MVRCVYVAVAGTLVVARIREIASCRLRCVAHTAYPAQVWSDTKAEGEGSPFSEPNLEAEVAATGPASAPPLAEPRPKWKGRAVRLVSPIWKRK